MIVRCFLLLALPALAAEPGFTDLFDGKTLRGWTLVPERGTGGYFVENGMLVSAPDFKGNLRTDEEYANFVLRFEFRLSDGGNNGIGIRTPPRGDAAYQGMEIQILDHEAPRYKNLKPWQAHGSIYELFPAKTGHLKRTEWNEEEITANGSKITVKLNGAIIVDADLTSITDPDLVKRHPGIQRKSGHIALLGHDSRIEFRNLRVKRLP